MQSNEASSHRTYVQKVLKHYKDNDIVQGDPNEGVWHHAHYPLPKHLGNQTVLLLREHHAVQGVLQSEEFQTPCIWNWEKDYLDGWLLERFHYWRSELSKKSGRAAAETNKRNGTGLFDPAVRALSSHGTFEGRQKGGRTAGRFAYKNKTGIHNKSDPRIIEGQLRGAKAPASRLLKHQHIMRRATPILITREDDGHVFYFDSCTHAEQVLGLSRKALRRNLDTNKSYKGHIITTF